MAKKKPDSEVTEETSAVDLGDEQAIVEEPEKKKGTLLQLVLFIALSIIACVVQMLIINYLPMAIKNDTMVDAWIFSQPLNSLIGFLVGNVVAKLLSYFLNRKATFGARKHFAFSMTVYVIMCVVLIIVETLIGEPLKQQYIALLGDSMAKVSFFASDIEGWCNILSIITYSCADLIIVFIMNKLVIMNDHIFDRFEKKKAVAAEGEENAAEQQTDSDVVDNDESVAEIVADSVTEQSEVSEESSAADNGVEAEVPAEEAVAYEGSVEETAEEPAEAVEEAVSEETVAEQPAEEQPEEEAVVEETEEAAADEPATEEDVPAEEAENKEETSEAEVPAEEAAAYEEPAEEAQEAPVEIEEAPVEETVVEQTAAEEKAEEAPVDENVVEEPTAAVEEPAPVEESEAAPAEANEAPVEEVAAAEEKPVEKKSSAKKASAKKPAAKKTADKKPAAKKADEKKTAAKKTDEKKPAAKKTADKKTEAKKDEPKKTAAKPEAKEPVNNVTVLFDAPETEGPKGKFVIIKDEINPMRPYKFQLKANNGQVLYESEGYKIKPRAKQIEVFRNTINNGSVAFDSEKNGTYRYKLFKPDGVTLYGVGEGYKSKAAAESAVESVKYFCNTSNTLEDTTLGE